MLFTLKIQSRIKLVRPLQRILWKPDVQRAVYHNWCRETLHRCKMLIEKRGNDYQTFTGPLQKTKPCLGLKHNVDTLKFKKKNAETNKCQDDIWEVVHALTPAFRRQISKFQASLIHKASSSSARDTQKNQQRKRKKVRKTQNCRINGKWKKLKESKGTQRE